MGGARKAAKQDRVEYRRCIGRDVFFLLFWIGSFGRSVGCRRKEFQKTSSKMVTQTQAHKGDDKTKTLSFFLPSAWFLLCDV